MYLLIIGHVYILTDILIRGVVVVVVAGGCVVLGCNIYILLYLYLFFFFCWLATYKGNVKVHSHYVFLHFCLQFDANAKNGFYTHSLHLTQHPTGAMLQLDATADANANAHA